MSKDYSNLYLIKISQMEHERLQFQQKIRDLENLKERLYDRLGFYECSCIECGCLGNELCGHKALDEDLGCTLNSDTGICPCCEIKNKGDQQ